MADEDTIRMLERLKNSINFEVTDAQAKMDSLNRAIEAIKILSDIESVLGDYILKKWENKQ